MSLKEEQERCSFNGYENRKDTEVYFYAGGSSILILNREYGKDEVTINQNMSNMDRKTALEILKDYQYWRRYDGPITDSPQMQDPKIIGQALDVAIEALVCLTSVPNKEYYGC